MTPEHLNNPCKCNIYQVPKKFVIIHVSMATLALFSSIQIDFCYAHPSIFVCICIILVVMDIYVHIIWYMCVCVCVCVETQTLLNIVHILPCSLYYQYFHVSRIYRRNITKVGRITFKLQTKGCLNCHLWLLYNCWSKKILTKRLCMVLALRGQVEEISLNSERTSFINWALRP